MDRIVRDPEILEKMEKALAQLSTAFRTLSKVFSLLMVEKGEKLPISEKKGVKVPNEDDEETPLQNVPDPPEWQEKVQDWLFSRRCRWGPQHGKHLAEFIIGRRWRGDLLKNFWKYTGPRTLLDPGLISVGERAYWQKVPESQVKALFEEYIEEIETSKEVILHAVSTQDTRWESLHGCRRGRLDNVLKSRPIPYNEFTRIMKEKHCEFPPLRKASIKVV